MTKKNKVLHGNIIEVQVDYPECKTYLKLKCSGILLRNELDTIYNTKADVNINFPERKIQITESEYDAIMKKYVGYDLLCGEKVKQELGFK